MNDTDRDLFSKYAQQKLDRQRPSSIPEDKSVDDNKDASTSVPASDTEAEGDGDDNVSDDAVADDDSSGLHTGVEAGVLPAGGEVSDTNDAPTTGRKKSARWLEYVREVRKDIKSEGVTKPDNKVVFQRAREYLQADGWL